MSQEEIQDWLATQVAQHLGVDAEEIDTDVPFDSYGLDSMQAMNIANRGKQYWRLELSPLVIWNYPNIEALSQYLSERLAASEIETLEI